MEQAFTDYVTTLAIPVSPKYFRKRVASQPDYPSYVIGNMTRSRNIFLFLWVLIFLNAAIYKDSVYLIEAKRTIENTNTYDSNFTYLFKFNIEPDGDVTLEQTFRLFHNDRDELLYGFRLAAAGDHKLVVYDLMGKSLLVFEDEHL